MPDPSGLRPIVVAAAAFVFAMAATGADPSGIDPVPRPGPPPVVRVEDVRAARDRGVAFLLRSQRPDGSWGSGRLISTAVASAIVTDDGRVAAGAVPEQVLTEALAR